MNRYKYPKTLHFPWSPGLQNDDRLIQSLDGFVGKRVIVTEKLDGENTSMYNDGIHARSIDGRHHPSRDWVKAFHGQIQHYLNEHERVCGENVYAEHSIRYENLDTYFYGFSLWHADFCFSWDTTLIRFEEMGITPVPVLYDGIWNEEYIRKLGEMIMNEEPGDPCEGYVVRTADGFKIDDFQKCVAKFVRKDHIQTDEHWMAKPVVPNGLKK